MEKVIFLNFDSFSKQKINFFNNVNTELSRNNLELKMITSEPVANLNFQSEKIIIKNKQINKDDKLIYSMLKLDEKAISEFIDIFKIYYPNDSQKLIKCKINYLIYYILKFFIINQPVLGIVWTEYYPISRIFIIICKFFKINYFISERGILRETIVLEKKGIYGKSPLVKKKISQSPNTIEYKNFLKVYKKLQVSWSQGKKTVIKTKKNEKKIKKIFFIGTNEIWHGFYPYLNSKTSPIYKSHLDVLYDLSKIEKKFTELEIYYKPHPKDRIFLKYKKLIPENIKIVENVNVYEKIKKSDLIITICSSLACDALIEKKPVLILGKFELSNKNICYELKNKNSFNKIIKLLINNKLKNNTKLWENFANYILKYYLYNISNHKFGEMNYRNFAAKVFNLAKKKKKIHLANRKNFNSINLWINKYIPERSFKSELKILLKKFFKKSS